MVPEAFSRTALLIGAQGVERLAGAQVTVFGIGGVGSFVVEALARAGVGALSLVDGDRIEPSNLNRQLHATCSTIGQSKVETMARRVQDINPAIQVQTHHLFCQPEDVRALLAKKTDYIVDAIDTVRTKLALVEEAYARNIPLISAMGAGNKLDPTRFEIADIYSTSVCPLCRVMRRELRRRKIPALKVVYSQEEPISPQMVPATEDGAPRRQSPGSISFVPSVAGLVLAGEVVRDLLNL